MNLLYVRVRTAASYGLSSLLRNIAEKQKELRVTDSSVQRRTNVNQGFFIPTEESWLLWEVHPYPDLDLTRGGGSGLMVPSGFSIQFATLWGVQLCDCHEQNNLSNLCHCFILRNGEQERAQKPCGFVHSSLSQRLQRRALRTSQSTSATRLVKSGPATCDHSLCHCRPCRIETCNESFVGFCTGFEFLRVRIKSVDERAHEAFSYHGGACTSQPHALLQT